MFAQSFPPANALMETMSAIDYKKHFHTFMDGVEIAVAFIAVIASMALEMWSKYDMTERVQIASLNAYTWTKEVAVPTVKQTAHNTYTFGVKVREVYDVLTARQFVTL
jgi:hypothetical protein